jgi:hypothetical protein
MRIGSAECGAQLAADVQTIHVRQHQVEHERIERFAFRMSQS